MIEKYTSLWHKENGMSGIGELIIDGNSTEFNSRFGEKSFSSTYVGLYGQRAFKVFTEGATYPNNKNSIDFPESHRVAYVLMKNNGCISNWNMNGIKGVTFEVPELIWWLGFKTVSLISIQENLQCAVELRVPEILLKDQNPRTAIITVNESMSVTTWADDSSAVTIKNIPTITMAYESAKDIHSIISDIECVMQFLGLLIGSISYAKNIQLFLEGNNDPMWLLLNHDFSYNAKLKYHIFNGPSTYYYVLKDKLRNYYDSWRQFYCDNTFTLLRQVYFSVNSKRIISIEEAFLEFMRFLDGYHARISGDEEKNQIIKETNNEATKKIKELLFCDEGIAAIETIMKKVDSNWKCSSKRKQEVAKWIAAGYLGQTSLTYRLHELDKDYFEIIENNALEIERNSYWFTQHKTETDSDIIEKYFSDLADTRNFYSHYKLDTKGLLETQQLYPTVNVLKALIWSILLNHMGMDKDLIRQIIQYDNELYEQTKFLIKEGEKRFEHP